VCFGDVSITFAQGGDSFAAHAITPLEPARLVDLALVGLILAREPNRRDLANAPV
jgi:hypothetical protein